METAGGQLCTSTVLDLVFWLGWVDLMYLKHNRAKMKKKSSKDVFGSFPCPSFGSYKENVVALISDIAADFGYFVD